MVRIRAECWKSRWRLRVPNNEFFCRAKILALVVSSCEPPNQHNYGKKVNLRLSGPGGGHIEISGEVVRSVGGDQAASGQPAGMAVAFDESSRGKQKDFITLVQSLTAGSTAPSAPGEQKAPVPQRTSAQSFRSIPDTHSGIKSAPSFKATPPTDPAAKVTPPKSPAQPFRSIPDTHSGVKSAPTFKATPPTDPAAKVTPRPAHVPPAQPPAPAAQPSPMQPTTVIDHQNPADLKKFLDDYKNKHTGTTYYDTLGITLKATSQEIENAYQQLSAILIITGPSDNLPRELASELASILNKVRKAHAILSKPDRKRAYDFIIDNSG